MNEELIEEARVMSCAAGGNEWEPGRLFARLADALEVAQSATVTSEGGLHALPVGSVALLSTGVVAQKVERYFWRIANEKGERVGSPWLAAFGSPLKVLYAPEATS